MSLADDGMVGLCLFGTARGLVARGGGALCGIERFPQVLEFRARRGEISALPHEGEVLRFRRVVRVGEQPYPEGVVDLLGVLGSARDVSRRAGFIGACVAVTHGRLDAYAEALEHSEKLYQEVCHVGLDGGLMGEDDEPSGTGEPFVRLGGGATDELWLHWADADGWPPGFAEEALCQVAWLDQHATSSVVLFPASRPGSEAVDGAWFGACREAKQQQFARVEADAHADYQRRLAALEQRHAQAVAADSSSEACLAELEHELDRLACWIRELRACGEGRSAPAGHGEGGAHSW